MHLRSYIILHNYKHSCPTGRIVDLTITGGVWQTHKELYYTRIIIYTIAPVLYNKG